ncbi:MAG: TSUP family transporter [Actinomycetota bacterium]
MPIHGGTRLAKLLAVGFAAGLLSGLLGVGGGVVIVPLLVLIAGFGQHAAHVTSLVAVIPIAGVAAAAYAFDDSISFGIAGLLALGGLIGAPLGARLMARLSEATLKIVFGAFVVGMGVVLALP